METKYKRALRSISRGAVIVCLLIAGALMLASPVLSAETSLKKCRARRYNRAATDPWGEVTHPLIDSDQKYTAVKSSLVESTWRVLPFIYVPGIVITSNSSEMRNAYKPEATVRNSGKADSNR